MTTGTESSATLATELASVRQYVTELEQQVATLTRDHDLLYALLDNVPEQVYFKDRHGRFTCVNELQAQVLGLSDPAAVIGKTDFDFYTTEIAGAAAADEQRIFATGEPLVEKVEEQNLAATGQAATTRTWVATTKAPMYAQDGTIYGIVGITRDVTARMQAEAANQAHAAQAAIIATQQALLAELSTPLLPIADGVIALPLLGTIDTYRAQQVMETLLTGVTAHHATTAILDITGVQVVDTQVANALIHAAEAVALLGAQVIVTGIRPEVAQTLVGLGANLGHIVTHSTLQRGIAYAVEQAKRG